VGGGGVAVSDCMPIWIGLPKPYAGHGAIGKKRVQPGGVDVFSATLKKDHLKDKKPLTLRP